jgi:hypothetical protein
MTVAIAWVRAIRDCEELLFVSDSRLSGDGRNLDVSPKILTLPRTDCAICFGGEIKSTVRPRQSAGAPQGVGAGVHPWTTLPPLRAH